MKKVALFALCAAALMTACDNAGQSKDALKAQNDSLMLELSNRDAELDEIMGSFNEIQEGFREINEAENRVDCREIWKASLCPIRLKTIFALSVRS